jgi:hypothetical protein
MIQTMNTVPVVIPGGMTSKLHILINKPFNDQSKQLHSEWLLVEGVCSDATGTIKKPLKNHCACGSRP